MLILLGHILKWSLVGGDAYLVSLATTIYFAGVMLGGAIFGQLGDRFGRRPILMLCMYSQIALGVVASVNGSFVGFVAVRFFVGAFVQVSILLLYIVLIGRK